MDEQDHAEPPVRRLKKRHIFGAVFLLLIILLLVAWSQRYTLADRAVRDQLDAAGVRASYEIDEIGLRTQRLTNVVVGDPANPDLTAKLVEINLTIGFGTPAIRSIWAEGVRVKGTYTDGQLRFGELDKFRDLQSKKPFELPDLNVALRNSSLALVTPWGALGIGLEGQGHLQRSFSGQAAFRSRALAGGGCKGEGIRFDGDVNINNRRPRIDGPIYAANVTCPDMGLAVAGPLIDGEFRLSERFDRWLGDAKFAAGAVRYAEHKIASPTGAISFDGGQERTNYTLKIDRAGYQGSGLQVQKFAADATGDLSFGDKGFALSARGGADLTGGKADTRWLEGLNGLAENTAATPVGPVIAQLVPSMEAVFRSFAASLNFDAAMGANSPSNAVISGLQVASASGARLEQSAPLEIRNGALRGAVRIALRGGGLPTGNVVLIPQGKGWSGTLALSPYAAKGGSLSIPKLAFSGGPGGNWRFDGQALLSGPLIGGYIDGLSVPVDGQWRGGQFLLLEGCRDIRFQSFKTSSFSLPGRSVRACPDGGAILQAGRGGTRLAFTSPSLGGNAFLGTTPVRYDGSQIRFSLDRGFIAKNVSVDLGSGDSITKMTMANIDGRFEAGGMRGAIENAHATIGSVPLLAENANGEWSYVREVLALDAALTVSDAEQVDRFKTLNVPDLALTLEDGLITAIGHLHEPVTGIRVADVDIAHRLSTSSGRALLAVENLAFNDRLQPEMLTPLTLGAIANVEGAVAGDGKIEWDASGVRSTGLFSTRGLNFAAAFGPVTGLSTDVAFTDLLGLETARWTTCQNRRGKPGCSGL